MLGSNISISGPNIVINTIVADELKKFADRLEKAKDYEDFQAEVIAIVKETMKKHSRIIFNGNNYSDEWVQEAEKRGLLNLKSTADAVPYFASQKNIDLFTRNKIFTEAEVRSRCEIILENYCKVVNIEALTALDMAKKDIIPAVFSYIKDLAKTVSLKKNIGLDVSEDAETVMISKLSKLANSLSAKTEALDSALLNLDSSSSAEEQAKYFRNTVISAMQELRAVADQLETMVGAKYWPFPCYGELLFSI